MEFRCFCKEDVSKKKLKSCNNSKQLLKMKSLLVWFFAGLILMLSPSCQQESTETENYLFELKTAEQTGVDFINDLAVELDLNIFNYLYYYNGAGLAIADFNMDSLPDILFTSNLEKERMYLNQGSLKFTDVSQQVNIDGGDNAWSTGVAVADINGDKLPDIYLCQVGKYRKLDNTNKLFICTGVNEEGIPEYKESSAEYGLDFQGFSTHAGFFDYDLDGDLDLFLLNHSLHQNGTFGQRRRFINTVDERSGDKLFRNDGGSFTDVTVEAGLQSSVIGYGLGLTFGDVNLDGYPDIYVGNDFQENDYLYINQKDGTFKEELTNQIRHTSKFSMGVDMADINNDCYPDIFSLDMMPEDPVILKRSEVEEALDVFRFKLNYGYNYQLAKNALQLNNGNNTFSEIGRYGGVHATDWSWSPLLFDMDLDGRKDLFVSNGIPKRMNDMDYIDFHASNEIKYKIQFDEVEKQDLSVIERIPEIKIHNKFFLGTHSLQFNDAESMIRNHKISYSNSAAYADLDNDGDLDVVTNNINDPAFIYENLTENPGERSVSVHLTYKDNNKEGLGTKVLAYQEGEVQYAEYFQSRGFQSSMSGPVILAKKNEVIDSLIIIWPDNTFTSLQGVAVNSVYVNYEQGLPQFDYNSLHKSWKYEWSSRENELGVDYLHEENDFVEFNREVLIPFSTSSEGPALAVGDINGDGLDDFFIGSPKWGKSGLFFQTEEGSFERIDNETMRLDSVREEIDAHIVDVNNDGANDLVIASGGNEFRLNNDNNAPVLYLNDGSGNLSRKKDAFGEVRLTAGTIQVLDFTGDGAPDVFVGARAQPWAYGAVPKSYCLENDGQGNFKDVTADWLPDEGVIGFVKGSSLADINGDDKEDIVLALEWDGIKTLVNKGSKFKLTEAISGKGWWNFVETSDFDNDGDMDIIAGNLGLNTRLKTKEGEPVRMYYNDFDDNGTREQLLSYYIMGKEVPYNTKKEIQSQLPFVKKKFVYASDFAEAQFADIFPVEKLDNYFEADEFRNMVFINDGRGGFEAKPLGFEAQQSTYYSAQPFDANGDELPDFLLMGNYFDANITMGRYDNNFGTILVNRGDGEFDVTQPGGDVLFGQVKNIQKIDVAGKEYWIIARNNESLKIVEFTGKNNLN